MRLDGGAAHKLSHRFMVGISDLLVKLPDRPAALLEVKHMKLAPRFRGKLTLAVSHLQEKFLKDYRAAGMLTGVLSGVQRERQLRLACYSLDTLISSCYGVAEADHTVDGRDPAAICDMIRRHIDDQP